ncbi:MAG: UbiX family flavin prenyltransferase [Bacteroidota bacterium]|nr:UbiX family flavin prenyltransferase [Bacteroidota bacterium]
MNKQKIIVAVTGASGSIYAKILLDKLLLLNEQIEEVGMIFSKNAEEIWQHELGNKSYQDYPFKKYPVTDFYAPFASGSAQYHTMIICPCSMGILGRIAHGTSDDLITRAADVTLKEKRKLILVPRETPYNLIHIKNMEWITLAGGTICPATPSFYSKPKSVQEIATTVIDRVLDLAGLQIDTQRWGTDFKE